MKVVCLLQDMKAYQYKSQWENLKEITEKEADLEPSSKSKLRI
jgi:hypothetical protein